MGPLISGRQFNTVTRYIESARQRGVEFATGGAPAVVEGYQGGFYFQPTVSLPVSPDDELAQEEVFGPVLTLISIEDVDQAIEIGNATRYGLAAGIHTRDIGKALRFARGIEAGQVFINGYHGAGDTVPFGGMKQSGVGREKGLAGMDSYYEVKAVTVTL